ncbi:hypothetical protein B9G69_010530 [Bdellovibrio sp. SKB1291214]|uniref:hypothetical protein n=1 Tax=Bdellovibrio sp. SKB1291214 TaxID=1732569 RepID=UPI000B51E071|nr:hypothetical protein [Bdellovibrio sp. SKB1291214]UYL07480.1 hypothetical protein B9G69_010530 [Bdellovibrio sp. SKB1291214]
MLNSLLILATTFSFAQAPLTCEKGLLRETTNGKTSEIKATYCFNDDKTILASKGCGKLDCKIAFRKTKFIDKSKVQSTSSNPGFNLCRELEGIPQIVEFKAGPDWYRLDRCTFKDGNFVSTSELLGFYMKPNL